MGSLVLLVVAAVWVAVLVPPLLRSRLENRPNSSVSDFRAQLSSLQRAVPSSRSGSMRSMARPLAPSPLARPAAAGRPPLRSGVKVAGGGSVRSAGQQAAMRPARADTARMQDASLWSRGHGEGRTHTHRETPQTRGLAVRRRRTNVLGVLVVTAGCAVFLALTTKTQGMTYAAVAACLALGAYLFVLAQSRPGPVRPPRSGPPTRRHADERPVPEHRAARPEFRGARAYQEPPPPRPQFEEPTPAPRMYQEPAPRRGADTADVAASRPARHPHRTQAVARHREERAARRRQHDDVSYDPRPSLQIYGEPALLGQLREDAARRRSHSRHSTTSWSPAV
jgi:hypothetical protein